MSRLFQFAFLIGGICLLVTTAGVALTRQDEPLEWMIYEDDSYIYWLHPDSGYERRAFASPDSHQTSQWIRHNDRFYFLMWTPTNVQVQLFRVDADGQNFAHVSSNVPKGIQSFRITRNDIVIAQSVEDHFQPSELYMLNLNNPTAEWNNLTNTPTVSDYFWTFSADGEWLYFSSQVENQTSEADIFRMRIDGTQKQLLSHIPAYGTFVDWSPDGEWLWFTIRLARHRRLYRLSTTSGTLEQLTNSDIIQTVGWAGNGAWFIFTASHESDRATYRISVDGTEVSRFLCPVPCGNSPKLSADRTEIIVSSCGIADCSSELFLIDIANNRVTQLASGESNRFLLEWLPDGDKIVYVRVSSNADRFQRYYFIADVDTQNPISLTQPNDFASFVGWSLDREWFIFNADSRFRHRSLYRIRSDGTDRQELTPNKEGVIFHTWSVGTVYVWNRLQSYLFGINFVGAALLIWMQSHQRKSRT